MQPNHQKSTDQKIKQGIKPNYDRLHPDVNRQIELIMDKYISKNTKAAVNQSHVEDWLEKKKLRLKFKSVLVFRLFEKIEV